MRKENNMKKLKRLVSSSQYADESDPNLILDDEIVLSLELPISVNASDILDKYPGAEQFRKDLISILEDEYQFEVIEDIYDGKKQKGSISPNADGVSIYFDTYFDLSNADTALAQLQVQNQSLPLQGKVYCSIHLRISDHTMQRSEGDIAYQHWWNQNVKKYAEHPEQYSKNVKSISEVFKDNRIGVSQENLYRHYSDALEEVRVELNTHILSWVKRAELHQKWSANR